MSSLSYRTQCIPFIEYYVWDLKRKRWRQSIPIKENARIIDDVKFQYQKINTIIFSNKLIKIHKSYLVNIKMFVILLDYHIQ